MDRIIGQCDWQKSPMIKVLVEKAPMALLKEAKPFVCRFNRDLCVDKCPLCVEIRRRLDRLTVLKCKACES